MLEAFKNFALADSLPLLQKEIDEHQNMILTAPTGSGKSLFFPYFLMNSCVGKIIVLEPRRLAARELAIYFSKCLGETCGETAGYKFRMERAVSSRTRVTFQTYGNFLQELLQKNTNERNDDLKSIDWILFDEFHERQADMDLLFAYFTALQKIASEQKTKVPRLAVLSAKIDVEQIEPFLNVKCTEAGKPLYPVSIVHQANSGKSPEQEICKALKTLERNGIWQTTLIFLPGKSEIRKAREEIENSGLFKNAKTYELYAGQSRAVQNEIFTPTEQPRLIFTTNIAETSLTVPNVSGVVDSGWERQIEFSEKENLNVLRTVRISLQNAVQRTGRAGRVQSGACIRLWSQAEENAMPKGIVPEVLRADLKYFLLCKAFLENSFQEFSEKTKISFPVKLQLLTELPVKRATAAKAELTKAEFLQTIPATADFTSTSFSDSAKTAADSTSANIPSAAVSLSATFVSESLAYETLTPLGREALESPLQSVQLSEIFLRLKNGTPNFLAFLAWLDAGNETFAKEKCSFNLETAIEELTSASRKIPKEVSYIYEKLLRFSKKKHYNSQQKFSEILPQLLTFFSGNLAIRSGDSFKLPDKTTLRVDAPEANALLAFSLLKTGTARSELKAAAYLEIPENLLTGVSDEFVYELLWRSGQSRFIGIEIRKNGNTEISRKEIQPQEASPKILNQLKSLCETYWLERFQRENLDYLYLSDENKTLFQKMKLAAQTFPEYNLPTWNDEDCYLVLTEFVSGIFLERDLTPKRYAQILEDYFGKSMIPWLHQNFPDFKILPNEKKARYSYIENSPVEISARLEDFLPCRGEHFIAEGRLKVRYDILAPNFRTVQKTWDLDGFWKNTYPEIRKELRGRYPKHPWPETVL